MRAFRVCLLLLLALPVAAAAQAPVSYRLSFEEAAHHVMTVEATFAEVPAGSLELRMSRSSPGRYAIHEFAKNVFDVRVTDEGGRALDVTRPNPHQWDVTGHSGTVRVTYRVFGDRVDGTYLGIDATHAHINMPAALMWARRYDLQPVSIRFVPPAGSAWRVATQLLPGPDPLSFTAPNLQYLMDSPAEASAFALRTFTVPDGGRTPVFRLAVHHAGSNDEVNDLARDTEAIVREMRHVFGELPPFENNTYTFIADYLPANHGDAMEHRNSTILTSSSSIAASRLDLLDSIAHEFFHAWNVERIRPRTLEPFDFEDANISGELWFAEGFTSYYAPLVMRRAGLLPFREFVREMERAVQTVVTSPGRLLRSPVEMSQHAPFVDAATSIDRNNFGNTFISYYTWGEALGLALDLSLRERSGGRLTLDEVMRGMWARFGRPGVKVPGYVETPYTIDDIQTVLAEVSGDAGFAADFFTRYVHGREVPDYRRLLAPAGIVVRTSEQRAWAGTLSLQDDPSGVRIAGDVPYGSPAYVAGLERGDVLVTAGGTRVNRVADVEKVLAARKPGDPLPVVFARRGATLSAALTLASDPRLEILPSEDAGETLTEAHRRVREAWLGSAARAVRQ